MGYFQVRYDSRVVIYDRRAFLRLPKGIETEVVPKKVTRGIIALNCYAVQLPPQLKVI